MFQYEEENENRKDLDSIKGAQKLLSAHSQIYNLFNHRRHLISRKTLRKFRQQAQAQWNLATASVCA